MNEVIKIKKPKKRKFTLIWWRKQDKEWRQELSGGGSFYITQQQVQRMFKSSRLMKVQDEYSRKIFHLEELG